MPRRHCGGDALNTHASRLLEGRGLAFRSPKAAAAAGEACKRTHGVVAWSDQEDTNTATFTIEPAWCESGGSIELSLEERKKLGEPLFNPAKFNKASESKGLAALIKQSINKSDIDLRKTLWGGVLLVGGGSSLNGTPERLEEDLFIISPDTIDVAVTASPGRDVMAWQGGAYLTTLPEFDNNWIHIEDREDPELFKQRIDDIAYNC